jgi:hypothetical protein
MRPLGLPRHRWEDSIKMDHRKMGWIDVNWIHLDQGPIVGSCDDSNEPLGSIKYFEFLV